MTRLGCILTAGKNFQDATVTMKAVKTPIAKGGIPSSAISCNESSFSLEERGILCGGSTIVIDPNTDNNPYLLLAVLNSSVFQKWVSMKMPSLGDGWRSLRVGIVREFPMILESKENKKLIREIVEEGSDLMSKFYITRDQKEKLSVIDQKVCSLYGTPELN